MAAAGPTEPSFPTFELPPVLSAALRQAAAEGMRAAEAEKASVRPLTPSERVLGLARVWAEARFAFAYWDQVPDLDWDGALQAYVPKVLEATDAAAYWALLAEFAALLRDGHTAVIPPQGLRAMADAEPAMQLEPVEGRPTVVACTAEAEAAGLVPGTVVMHVDGEPVEPLLAAAMARLGASTAHGAAFLATRQLLRGPQGTPVRVSGERPDGSAAQATLPRRRGAVYPWQRREPVGRREVAPGVVVAELRSLAHDGVTATFHALFPDFVGVRALILDLRENGGGSTGVGWAVLARLLAEPAQGARSSLRMYVPTWRAWGWPQPWLVSAPAQVEPDPERPRFAGPAAVLVGPGTASAAEDLLVSWRSARRGPVVGSPTYGSTGQPLTVPLPGGGSFRVCTKRDTFPDGSPFVGVGILPDVPAARTVAGLAAGRDEVLEAAVRILLPASAAPA